MSQVKRSLILVAWFAISCGGRVVDEPNNAAADTGGTDKIAAADTSAPPSTPTSSPAPDAMLPPPDATPAKPAGELWSCSDGPVTGSPMGCGPARVCNEGDTLSDRDAELMLSCLVDRCAMETTGKPWCGMIKLGFDTNGCTAEYVESGTGTGGCVKYQGLFRVWPCLAGRSITVERTCR